MQNRPLYDRATFWLQLGGALSTIGGIVVAIGVAQVVTKPDANLWANLWFDGGLAVVAVGVALLGWALVLYLADKQVERRTPGAEELGYVKRTLPPTPQIPLTIPTYSRALSAEPAKVERIYSDATVAYLVGLGRTPNLTGAERARLVEPQVGKWLRIEGVVDDVNAYKSFVQVLICSEPRDPTIPCTVAHFDRDIDRAAALPKGARIRVAGRFTGTSNINASVSLDDCELLN
jgi:hypothetical protein